MGNPFEWLRSMARRGGDDDELVAEAAGALAVLGTEPAGLVAARQLLAHHRHHGGLWWLVSHVLCAADPAAAARACAQTVDGDRTAARLAATLGLQGEGEHLGVIGWSDALEQALDERPDLDALAVVDPDDRTRSRRASSRAALVDPWELADAGVSILLVPAHAVGPRVAIVDAAIHDAIAEVPRADVWVVAPLSRLLPEPLADALVAAVHDDESCSVLPIAKVDRIAGPRGVEAPADAIARTDCPVAAELLRGI